MWPDRVSNPGPLTSGSGALPTALRGPADLGKRIVTVYTYRHICIYTAQPIDSGPYSVHILMKFQEHGSCKLKYAPGPSNSTRSLF